jgi:hypothetical protein
MNPRLPALKPREVLQALKGLDSSCTTSLEVTTSSSALITPRCEFTLTYHTRDLKRGTLASIIEQVGLTTEAFMDLL